MITVTVSGDDKMSPFARFNFLNAAKTWADVVGPAVRARLQDAAPVGKSQFDYVGGTLRKSIRYQRRVSEGGVRLEFVTAVPYAPYVIDGTPPHIIRARQARALRWLGYGHAPGAIMFAKSVHHPGTKPNPFPQRVMGEMAPFLQQTLRNALSGE